MASTSKGIPKASAFPPALCPVIIATNHDDRIANLVLFLPGFGDSSANFAGFARALNLPETLCIVLQGPTPLPAPLPQGFQWGDDIIYDQSSDELDPDAGFVKAIKLTLQDTIDKVCIKQCGFVYREIVLFGYGQGGMAALAIAIASESTFGGIISVGGTIPSSLMLVNRPKNTTPVLLLGGRKGVFARDNANGVKKVKLSFDFVEHHGWQKSDDTMPKSREETLPLMQFLARRLRSLKGVPSGAVELN